MSTYHYFKSKASNSSIRYFAERMSDGTLGHIALLGLESELLKRNIISLETGETASDRWLVVFTDAHYEAFPTKEAAKEFLLKKYGGQSK